MLNMKFDLWIAPYMSDLEVAVMTLGNVGLDVLDERLLILILRLIRDQTSDFS